MPKKAWKLNVRILPCAIAVCCAVAVAADPMVGEEPATRQIHVDVNQERGPFNRAFQFSVGSDRAMIHLRQNTSAICGFSKKLADLSTCDSTVCLMRR